MADIDTPASSAYDMQHQQAMKSNGGFVGVATVNETSKQRIRDYFQAVNEERWDDVMALYSPDAVLNVPGRPPKVGHDRIRPFYEDLGSRYEKHTAEIKLLLAEGDTAAATIEYEGRKADGGSVSTFACDNFVFEGGLIKELRIVFDSARVGL
jgi:ketosteroid isomerase-like protein